MTLTQAIFEEVQAHSLTVAQLAAMHMQAPSVISEAVDRLCAQGKLHHEGALLVA